MVTEAYHVCKRENKNYIFKNIWPESRTFQDWFEVRFNGLEQGLQFHTKRNKIDQAKLDKTKKL